MKQKDISIALSNEVLTVKGGRMEKAEPSRIGYRNKEINFGSFERNIYLSFGSIGPENLDPDNVMATYQEGFLEITLKKKKGKKIKGKEIKIEEV
jgi:HSP20 family protein